MDALAELDRLQSFFPGDQPLLVEAEHVAGPLVPEPYKSMLVHDRHMTVTMERYHDCKVDVHVLDRAAQGDTYMRKIILTREGTDIPVQFGLVRFNFEYVTKAVREEIESESIPLGRVLINHNVLRIIDLGAILRVTAGPGLAKYLKMDEGQETYGRLATIFCNQKPAVDLLEISAPLKAGV